MSQTIESLPSARRVAARHLVVLVLILLAAAFLRLSGVNWDQGTHLHPDERFLTMVAADIRMPESLAAYFDTARSPLNPANVGRPFFVYGTLPLFVVRSVAESVGMTGYGDFWVHLLVAEGAADAAVEAQAAIWDVAALKIIVEEAGGRFTDFAGQNTPAGGNGLSTNGLLHDELLARLRK